MIFSIIIVNYNGKHYLDRCLNSIFNNNYSKFEIIIVDNNSTDGSIEYINNKFSLYSEKIKIVSLNKNYGPAYARNKGFEKSSGNLICFLDNDTQVHPNWLITAKNLFNSDKQIGCVQSKLLLANQKNKIDYVGEYMGNLGFLKSTAQYGEIDNGQYDTQKTILAAKSAGMFIRRQAFIDAGKFDPDYFIFMEESDLGWRTWLAGYKNVLCPESIVYHQFSSTKDIVDPDFNNYLVRFHGTKNYIQTLIKNFSFSYLIKILPIHIVLWFSLATYLLLTGKFLSAKNIYKGIAWNFINFYKIIKKRRLVQKSRKVSDFNLFVVNKLMVNTSLSLYIKKFFDSQRKNKTPENKIK